MKSSTLLRKCWVILLQGILLIVLSILIFNNPDTVVSAIAWWLGAIVTLSGLVGCIGWFNNDRTFREIPELLGSFAMVIVGLLMISKIVMTVGAITLVFGLLTSLLGVILLTVGWKGRKEYDYWWLVALLGAATLVMGIKSMLDVNSGAANISTLLGFPVLLAGIGLVAMAFLKRRLVKTLENKIANSKAGINVR